jgi:hypothetical protein
VNVDGVSLVASIATDVLNVDGVSPNNHGSQAAHVVDTAAYDTYLSGAPKAQSNRKSRNRS